LCRSIRIFEVASVSDFIASQSSAATTNNLAFFSLFDAIESLFHLSAPDTLGVRGELLGRRFGGFADTLTRELKLVPPVIGVLVPK
jgi:hypothetical protein